MLVLLKLVVIFHLTIANLNGSNDAGDGLSDAWMPWQSVRALTSGPGALEMMRMVVVGFGNKKEAK